MPYSKPQFIEYALTYLMFVPSLLQTTLLPNLTAPTGAIPAETVKHALQDAGFQDVDQIYSTFGPYIGFLTKARSVDSLRIVKWALYDSGVYSGGFPHPPAVDGKSFAQAMEQLAQ